LGEAGASRDNADYVCKILGEGKKILMVGDFLHKFFGIEYLSTGQLNFFLSYNSSNAVTNAYLMIHSRGFHINKSIAYNLSLGNELRNLSIVCLLQIRYIFCTRVTIVTNRDVFGLKMHPQCMFSRGAYFTLRSCWIGGRFRFPSSSLP